LSVVQRVRVALHVVHGQGRRVSGLPRTIRPTENNRRAAVVISVLIRGLGQGIIEETRSLGRGPPIRYRPPRVTLLEKPRGVRARGVTVRNVDQRGLTHSGQYREL